MRSPSVVRLAASVVLAGSTFLPWLRLGDVGLAGVPDPAGYFVLGLGVAGVILTVAGRLARRSLHHAFMLLGLAGLTTLVVVWRIGPSTIADRAQAHAEAVALVNNVAAQPVPPVTVGPGLWLGLAASVVLAALGLSRALRSGQR